MMMMMTDNTEMFDLLSMGVDFLASNQNIDPTTAFCLFLGGENHNPLVQQKEKQ